MRAMIAAFVLTTAAAWPAHSATGVSLDEPDARWVCQKTRYGRKCRWYSRYDEPMDSRRSPLCLPGYPWRCLPR